MMFWLALSRPNRCEAHLGLMLAIYAASGRRSHYYNKYIPQPTTKNNIVVIIRVFYKYQLWSCLQYGEKMDPALLTHAPLRGPIR